MENGTEKAYSPKEISTTLDIGDSTLRKWCIAMEKNGYGFIRNEQNKRVFVESDLVVLRHFQNLVKQHNMQLDNASTLVIDRFGNGAFEVRTGIVLAEKEEEQRDLTRSNEDIMGALLEHIRTQSEVNRELLTRLNQQENFNRELILRLDQQQTFLEGRDEQAGEREKEQLEQHDKRLMESIRINQELKKINLENKELLSQIAASQEEEKKKGFWAKILGK
jgi:hypothetical protein